MSGGGTGGYAFAVERDKVPAFARKRARRGTTLVVLGLVGLVFGVFWIVWGIVLILLSDTQRWMGLMVSIVAAGPTIGGWIAMSGGLRHLRALSWKLGGKCPRCRPSRWRCSYRWSLSFACGASVRRTGRTDALSSCCSSI